MKRKPMLLVWTKLGALAALAFVAGSAPAFATIVIDTFADTVTAGDSVGDVTTKSIGKEVSDGGGTSLVNDSFALPVTIDTSKFALLQPDLNVNGATYYSGTSGDNPIADALRTVPLPPSLLLLAPGLLYLVAARKTVRGRCLAPRRGGPVPEKGPCLCSSLDRNATSPHSGYSLDVFPANLLK